MCSHGKTWRHRSGANYIRLESIIQSQKDYGVRTGSLREKSRDCHSRSRLALHGANQNLGSWRGRPIMIDVWFFRILDSILLLARAGMYSAAAFLMYEIASRFQ